MSSVAVEGQAPAKPVAKSPGAAADDMALFHRTLAELCRAQVPLPRALRLLQSDLRRGKLRQAVGAMAEAIENGVPLGDAYGQHQRHFPKLYRALVDAGIRSGNLPGVLDEIAHHAHERAATVDRLRQALAYPAVAAGFVVALGSILVLFVGPHLSASLLDLTAAMSAETVAPSTTTWIPAASGLGLLVLVTVAAITFAWLRSPLDPGSALDGIGYRLPLVGRLRLFAAKASFASTMALLARRGLSLPQALMLSATATDDNRVRECIQRMSSRAEEGANLTDSVRAGDLISPSLLWLVEAAESSGSASDALDDVARIYRERLDRSVDRLCAMATPLAELMLGIIVLGFAMSYLLPMVQYADAMSP